MDVPENKDAPSVVVTLGLDVGIGEQENREDDGDDIPSREDETNNSVNPLH